MILDAKPTIAQQVFLAAGLPKDGVPWAPNRAFRRRIMHFSRRIDPLYSRATRRREAAKLAADNAAGIAETGVDRKYLHSAACRLRDLLMAA